MSVSHKSCRRKKTECMYLHPRELTHSSLLSSLSVRSSESSGDDSTKDNNLDMITPHQYSFDLGSSDICKDDDDSIIPEVMQKQWDSDSDHDNDDDSSCSSPIVTLMHSKLTLLMEVTLFMKRQKTFWIWKTFHFSSVQQSTFTMKDGITSMLVGMHTLPSWSMKEHEGLFSNEHLMTRCSHQKLVHVVALYLH